MKLYVERNGRRYGGFVANEFKQMPDPKDHPVFRLSEAPADEKTRWGRPR